MSDLVDLTAKTIPDILLTDWLDNHAASRKFNADQRNRLAKVEYGLDFKLGRSPGLVDLCLQTEWDLLRLPNVGRFVLQIIKSLLLADSLHLGMEFDGEEPPQRPLIERLRRAPPHLLYTPLLTEAAAEIERLNR